MEKLFTDNLLTINEAAQRLSISPQTIRKWLYKRLIKPVKIGRSTRLRESEINKMVLDGFIPKGLNNERR